MMLKLVVLAALLGCVQSYKILAKYPAPAAYYPEYTASSYYAAPVYASRVAPSYEYQPSTYKQVEITKYSSPLQTIRNPLAGGFHLGRQPYQPIAVPVPVAVPVGQSPYGSYGAYGSYGSYNPYRPYVAYTPHASEPILKATYSSESTVAIPSYDDCKLFSRPICAQLYPTVRSSQLIQAAPLHYSATKGGLTQQETKGAPEPPRQQEIKGQEPQRELSESAKGYRARPQQEQLPQQQQQEEEQWEQKPRDQVKSIAKGEIFKAGSQVQPSAPESVAYPNRSTEPLQAPPSAHGLQTGCSIPLICNSEPESS